MLKWRNNFEEIMSMISTSNFQSHTYKYQNMLVFGDLSLAYVHSSAPYTSELSIEGALLDESDVL